MRALLLELRAFLTAALVTPVPSRFVDPPERRTRRRIVSLLTLLAGAVLLGWTISVPPGDPRFVAAAFALAGLWAVGAVLSGRLPLGTAHTRAATHFAVPVIQPLALGLLLLGIFLAGALVVGGIPVLREPVDGLLAHAVPGSLAVVIAITLVNGVAEELFFRGALFAALPERWAVLGSACAYVLSTVGTGVPLLVFAAAVLGLVTAAQRRVTGGFLAPTITHLTWSIGMLLLLPVVLDLGR
ncbi:MAG: CPBP family intramembrane metalloprotease [Micropruina sp.]|nr:CPBP family intramembrane metalloprotease [Micropruina sp.]